ncbi:MAG: PDZ domain-containing protein, partial [Planctomycetales bacterium]|nr:PDZ domain-containing protein [Planctomycetales bacterium]
SDDFEKVNADGLVRVAELVADVAGQVAETDARPTYVESKATGPTMNRSGDRPYFGSIPDFAQAESGYGISGVTKASPADKAGLKGGDLIIKLGGSTVTNLDDFDAALRRFKAGDKVPVIVKRDGKEVTLTVTLGAPR